MKSLTSLNPSTPLFRLMAALMCPALLVFADVLAWGGAYQLVGPVGQMAWIKFAIMSAAWCAWAAFVHQQYTRRHPYWSELGFIFQGILMLAFVGSMLKALIGNADSLWAWWIACGALALLLPTLRGLVRLLLRRLGLWDWPTLVFGGGENALQAVLALRGEPVMGYAVEALVVPTDHVVDELNSPGVSLMSWPASANDLDILRNFHCVIALEAHESELRDKLIRQLSHHRDRPGHPEHPAAQRHQHLVGHKLGWWGDFGAEFRSNPITQYRSYWCAQCHAAQIAFGVCLR